MSILHLVRHGPTHLPSLVGWSDVDVDLSDTQALARLNAGLPDVPIISSDLKRASQTADGIAGMRLRLDHSSELREFNFGDWEGMTAKDVSNAYPKAAYDYWANPGDHCPPNGESWNTGAVRFSQKIDSLLDTHDDVIVVAHMGMILTQIARAADITAHSALSFQIDNFSLTTLERLDAKNWRVLGINHVL